MFHRVAKLLLYGGLFLMLYGFTVAVFTSDAATLGLSIWGFIGLSIGYVFGGARAH